jgi:hypothetical protein
LSSDQLSFQKFFLAGSIKMYVNNQPRLHIFDNDISWFCKISKWNVCTIHHLLMIFSTFNKALFLTNLIIFALPGIQVLSTCFYLNLYEVLYPKALGYYWIEHSNLIINQCSCWLFYFYFQLSLNILGREVGHGNRFFF